MPSKELLSVVFTTKVIRVIKTKGSKIYYDTKSYENCTMNRYQLINYMKIWAYGLGYDLFSNINCCEVNESYTFDAPTEFEAVTKACEWVLNANQNT